MSAASDFVHLHVHTDYSLLDGACRVDRLMARAKELGMKAIALTDHGNMFGAIEFYNAAKAASLKPLIGCELYVAPGSRLEKSGKSEDGKSYFHLGVLAKNLTGYQNLLKLVSDAHLKGFYYKPRTDLEVLARYAEGLIGFTGCLAAEVPQHLLRDRWEDARTACARYRDIFGRENYFVEIQDHGLPEQRKIVPGLLKLAEEFGLKVICSNDVHYVRDVDAAPHDAMLCIQTGAKLAEEGRMKFDSQQFYLKTRDEMAAVFGELPESLTNTLAVAEMCDLAIPFPKGSERYPRYPLPPEVKSRLSPPAYLAELCVQGLAQRYGTDHAAVAARPKVAERLAKLTNLPAGQKPQPPDYSGLDLHEEVTVRMAYELAIINVTGFVDYFLVVWDFIAWAKQHAIPVGPGRGSGAGCLVAYVLGITNLDPIRFKLLFERFLNPERVSPPDFDIDFCMRRREEVIDYVREKYGRDCVANIITYGTLGAKMVIRDVSRVHDLPFAEADRLAKMIPDEINISLEDAITKSQELREEIARNPTAKKIVEAGRVLEGMVRNTGKHAAGIIITDKPLDDFVPLTAQEGDVTVQFDMNAVGKLGLLKMDFLGLKTLTVISDAVANVRRVAKPDFDIETIPLDDPRTYEILNAGKTVGVFQLESGGMQSACKQVGVSNIDDINAICALYRPGPMAFIPDYARGKRDPQSVAYPHPLLEQSLQETYGIIVYQEQVMECAKIIAGYTLGGADMLRRAMGKKDAEAMAKERIKFVEGAKQTHGMSEGKANEIFDLLNKFAQYGFNKSHSAAYALVSYQTAYLKANYPVEFMAAVLTAELGNAEKVSHFIGEASAMGLQVLGPDINESRETFTPVFRRRSGDAAIESHELKVESQTAGNRSATSPGPSSDLSTFNSHLSTARSESSIRFGLAGIKGVGEAASQKIIAERDARGPFKHFDDLVTRVDPRAINKRVLEHLIKTGAFDFAGESRKSLFDRVDQAMAGAAAQARDRAAGQGGFFDLLADPTPAPKKGRGAASAGSPLNSQLSTLNSSASAAPSAAEDFTPAEKLAFEKELLGFYLSGHPMNDYAGLAEALNTFAEDELLQQPDRAVFRLCGLAASIVKRLSKKDNRPWASFTLATKRANLELNMFADAYAEYAKYLLPDQPIVVLGTVRKSEEGTRLQIAECYPLEGFVQANIKKITWLLTPDHPQVLTFLRTLRDSIDTSRGDTRTELGFLVEGRVAAVSEISHSLGWKLRSREFQRLRQHAAVAGLLFETRRIELKDTGRWANKRKG